MKKVLISVLVSSLLVGAIIAKPKAKVETNSEVEVVSSEPEVPKMTLREWLETRRNVKFEEVFPGLSADVVLTKKIYGKVRNTQYVYIYTWVVGMDDSKSWDAILWSAYEYGDNPYKKEMLGSPDKESFLVKLSQTFGEYDGFFNSWTSPDWDIAVNDSMIKSLGIPIEQEDLSESFLFVWVYSDGFVVYYPKFNYNQDKSGSIKRSVFTKYSSKKGFSNEPYYYLNECYLDMSTTRDFGWNNLAPDKLFEYLEPRIKSEGTKEQLEQFYIVKNYMEKFYSEE